MRFWIPIAFLMVLGYPAAVFAQGQENPDVAFTRIYVDAGKEKNLGNPEKALHLYQRCLLLQPENDAVYYEIGQIFFELGRTTEAQSMFAKASTLDSDNTWYKLRLAKAYESEGKYRESGEVWKGLYEGRPGNMEYVDHYGQSLLYTGKTKQAIKLYDDVEKRLGVNEATSIMKQKIYLNDGKLDKAASELEKLIKAYPNEPDYYGALADMYNKNNEPEKALKTYERAIKIDPDNAFIQLSLAEYYDRQANYEKSNEYLERAFGNRGLDIDTKVTILLRLYPIAEKDLEVREQAMNMCRILTEAHPEDPKSSSVYGDFLLLEKSYRQAQKQYETAVSIDPSRFAIWSQLLFLDSELNDEIAMLKHSKTAMELFPIQPLPFMFNGLANIQTQNYEAAVQSLEQGSQLVVANPPLSSQMLSSLGDAYHELGENEKSDSAYELALSFDPSNIYVLNNYAYFLSLRGEKLERAKEMSGKTLDKQPLNASYLDTYGWILFQLGEYEDARTYLLKSLDNGAGNSGEVLEHLGDTLFKLGLTSEALNYWRRAKEAGDASENIDAKIEKEGLVE